jgi:hypothetical protein
MKLILVSFLKRERLQSGLVKRLVELAARVIHDAQLRVSRGRAGSDKQLQPSN